MTEEQKNEVYIGNKPFMNYVTGAVMHLNTAKKVSIKARGKYISKAVDVAEVVRNRFLQDAKIESINIGSEEFEGKNGKTIRVSTIEINLKR